VLEHDPARHEQAQAGSLCRAASWCRTARRCAEGVRGDPDARIRDPHPTLSPSGRVATAACRRRHRVARVQIEERALEPLSCASTGAVSSNARS
jgi:hypothetical protein